MGNKKKKSTYGKKKSQQQKKHNKQTKSFTAFTASAPAPIPQTVPATSEKVSEEFGVIGLTNLANTCYFNSVLQLLLSSSYLKEYMNSLDLTMVSSKLPLTAALHEIFQVCCLKQSKKTSFKPNRALGAIRAFQPIFKGRTQHDAHELLMTLIQLLVEEGENCASQQDSISSTLSGSMSSILTCMTCGYSKSEREHFMVMSAAIVKDDPAESSNIKAAVLNEVVEREGQNCSESKPDESPQLNNLSEDSNPPSSISHSLQDEEDDAFVFWPDLFNLDEDQEEVIEELLLSENEGSEKVNNSNNNGEGNQWKRKGKKKKKKKGGKNFSFDDWTEDSEDTAEKEKMTNEALLTDLESCLDRFFSTERVTWRCAGEYPEKKVTFSDLEPEIFILPPLESQTSVSSIPSIDEDASTDNEESAENNQEDDQTEQKLKVTVMQGLKSCLKKKKSSPKLPIPPLSSTKQYVICKQPKFLCIHLKRFEFGRRRYSGKLSHKVQFETSLDLNKFSNFVESSHQPFNYDLKAVVCHSGTLNFGHYTAYVSRKDGDGVEWYYVSDTQIDKVSIAKVLKAQAYILLYEAVTQNSSSSPPVPSSGSNSELNC